MKEFELGENEIADVTVFPLGQWFILPSDYEKEIGCSFKVVGPTKFHRRYHTFQGMLPIKIGTVTVHKSFAMELVCVYPDGARRYFPVYWVHDFTHLKAIYSPELNYLTLSKLATM